MRIIAGQFRSRVILPPEDESTTRPITDRVKQSLFDILTPLLEDARVYDCFAGTGSMGLESLSRGASHATFFEADRSAASRLRRNIETLKVEERSVVVTQDLFKWFDATPALPEQQRAGVIFLDPPYRFLTERRDALKALTTMMATRHLAPEGIIVFRHDAGDRLELPGLIVEDRREYGGMMLDCLRIGAGTAGAGE